MIAEDPSSGNNYNKRKLSMVFCLSLIKRKIKFQLAVRMLYIPNNTWFSFMFPWSVLMICSRVLFPWLDLLIISMIQIHLYDSYFRSSSQFIWYKNSILQKSHDLTKWPENYYMTHTCSHDHFLWLILFPWPFLMTDFIPMIFSYDSFWSCGF